MEKCLKKIARLIRDKNFLELEKKRLVEELEIERSKNDFLMKRERTLQTVESYLVGRANVLKKVNNRDLDFAVIELEKLSKALEEERNSIYEVEDEREDDTRTCNEIERDSKRTRYITNRV